MKLVILVRLTPFGLLHGVATHLELVDFGIKELLLVLMLILILCKILKEIVRYKEEKELNKKRAKP